MANTVIIIVLYGEISEVLAYLFQIETFSYDFNRKLQ